MFGQNKIVSAGMAARDSQFEKLRVTSIFFTIQGEGPFMGQPAVFVRLAHCNLNCSFCDTYFDSGDIMHFDEIYLAAVNEVKRFHAEIAPKLLGMQPLGSFGSFMHAPLMVITGGEPTIQPGLVRFLRFMRSFGWDIKVESNGLVAPNEWPEDVYLVISPKVNERMGTYIRPHSEQLARADSLKFVVSSTMPGYTDVPEFGQLWRTTYPTRQMFITPMNMYLRKPTPPAGDTMLQRTEGERISFWEAGLLDQEANRKNHEYAALIAMRYNATLSLQMHLYANLP